MQRRKDVGNLLRFAQNRRLPVSNVEIESLSRESSEEVSVIFMLNTNGKVEVTELLEEFSSVEGMNFISQI